MHWRRFAVSAIPLGTLEEFDAWLQKRWLEKEKLLEEHALTGRFPSKLPNEEALTAEVRLRDWGELWWMGGMLVCIAYALTRVFSFSEG